MVQGIIAGGFRAVKDPVEGAEDNEELGAADLDEHGLEKTMLWLALQPVDERRMCWVR